MSHEWIVYDSTCSPVLLHHISHVAGDSDLLIVISAPSTLTSYPKQYNRSIYILDTPCHTFSVKALSHMASFDRIVVTGASLAATLTRMMGRTRSNSRIHTLIPPLEEIQPNLPRVAKLSNRRVGSEPRVETARHIYCRLSDAEAVSDFTAFYVQWKKGVRDSPWTFCIDAPTDLLSSLRQHLEHYGIPIHLDIIKLDHPFPSAELNQFSMILHLEARVSIEILQRAGQYGIPLLASGSFLVRDYLIHGRWVAPREARYYPKGDGLVWRPYILGMIDAFKDLIGQDLVDTQKWTTAAVSFSLCTSHPDNFRKSFRNILEFQPVSIGIYEIGTGSSEDTCYNREWCAANHIQYIQHPDFSRKVLSDLLVRLTYVCIIHQGDRLDVERDRLRDILVAYLPTDTSYLYSSNGEIHGGPPLCVRNTPEVMDMLHRSEYEDDHWETVGKGCPNMLPYAYRTQWPYIGSINPFHVVIRLGKDDKWLRETLEGLDRGLMDLTHISRLRHLYESTFVVEQKPFHMYSNNIGSLGGEPCQWWIDSTRLMVYVWTDRGIQTYECDPPVLPRRRFVKLEPDKTPDPDESNSGTVHPISGTWTPLHSSPIFLDKVPEDASVLQWMEDLQEISVDL